MAYNINKRFEFINIIEACGLIDLGYNGQHFTWCNHRAENEKDLTEQLSMISGLKLGPRLP